MQTSGRHYLGSLECCNVTLVHLEAATHLFVDSLFQTKLGVDLLKTSPSHESLAWHVVSYNQRDIT